MDSQIFDSQEQQKATNKNLTLGYGLVTAGVMIVLGLIFHFAGLSMAPWTQYVSLAVLLVGVIMVCRAFGKSRNNIVTFGNVFGAGFRMVAFTTVLMVIWSVIFALIFPELKDKSIEIAQEKMYAQGLPEDQIEIGLNMTRKYFIPFMIMGILFSYLLYGVVFSLIGALVTKKVKPEEVF